MFCQSRLGSFLVASPHFQQTSEKTKFFNYGNILLQIQLGGFSVAATFITNNGENQKFFGCGNVLLLILLGSFSVAATFLAKQGKTKIVKLRQYFVKNLVRKLLGSCQIFSEVAGQAQDIFIYLNILLIIISLMPSWQLPQLQ
eukprot:TRINITY_DN10435_c0_g2_i1.p5 TRINITY_DN10435_c0_g2~~TRINITY_DN10435_c0_g2_i1.p5  ORF type:complete len:143 (-),score=10.71 TRINITY_DN10435_c0_g2_i1:699-1127(-)